MAAQHVSLLAILCASVPALADVQQRASTGAIEGIVSARQGGGPLPGAEVVVSDDSARVAARPTSDGEGRDGQPGARPVVPGTGFQSAARMLSSVMTTSNGVNIKGGRAAI